MPSLFKWATVAGYAMLQVADLLTTHLALGKGAIEGNPFMIQIVESLPLMIGAKLLVVGSMVLFAVLAPRVIFYLVTGLLITLYAFVVMGNIQILLAL